MAKLSQIVRNRAEITVEIPGADEGEDGAPVMVPVTVTYKPRLMTPAWRDQFGGHLRVVQKAERTAKEAAERNDTDAAMAAVDDPAVSAAVDQMAAMTLGLLDSWDLEDDVEEDGKTRTVPVPLPTTAAEVETFPAADMFQTVLRAVMGKLNPNRAAGETTNPEASPAG